MEKILDFKTYSDKEKFYNFTVNPQLEYGLLLECYVDKIISIVYFFHNHEDNIKCIEQANNLILNNKIDYYCCCRPKSTNLDKKYFIMPDGYDLNSDVVVGIDINNINSIVITIL